MILFPRLGVSLSYLLSRLRAFFQSGRCSLRAGEQVAWKGACTLNSNASQIIPNIPASKNIPLTEITPTLYRDLRRIASRHLGAERPNHTLQATALLHEAYLKLAKERTPCFSD